MDYVRVIEPGTLRNKDGTESPMEIHHFGWLVEHDDERIVVARSDERRQYVTPLPADCRVDPWLDVTTTPFARIF